MSKGTDGNEGIVDLPENATSQDAEADGNKSSILPKGHQNANMNPNDHMTSKNQETKVPDNKQCQKGGNTEPPNTQSQDESLSLDPNSESTTIDDIPNVEIHPAWISRTVYTADTQRNYFMDEAVQHVDPQIKGIARETVHGICEISSTSQENVHHFGSEIHDFVVKTAHHSDSEAGSILKHTFKAHSEIGGILEDTVQSMNSEFGGILGDASGLLQQPFPLYSAALSNNNTQEGNDNNAMSDILTDSAANLVENDVTQMSKSLTVNVKADMESASCILGQLGPNMTLDHTTENNPDGRLLPILSFPHTPILIPAKTEEGETHQITFTLFLISKINKT